MTYRAAIIGAGRPVRQTNANLEGFSIGYAHARAYEAHPQVEVVAVADVVPEYASALATHVGGARTYTDHRAMLEQERPDIVSVCTWPTLHRDMTVDAAELGIALIWCEKPMAVSVRELDEMVAAATAAGVRLFINHQRRYEQPYAGARELIRAGHLGVVRRLEGYVGDGWDLMSWGSHWVDMVRFFAGEDDIRTVLAQAAGSGGVRYGHRVEDRMLLQLQFGSGALALIHTGPHTTGAGLIVTGSRGTLQVGPTGPVLHGDGSQNVADLTEKYLTVPADGNDGFTLALADIVAAQDGKRPCLIDSNEGHKATEIIMAAYASAASARVLDLPLTDRTVDIRA